MLILMPHWLLLLLAVIATLRLRREAVRVGGRTALAASLPWLAWFVAAVVTTAGANLTAIAFGLLRGVASVPTPIELLPVHLGVGFGYLAFLDNCLRRLMALPSIEPADTVSIGESPERAG